MVRRAMVEPVVWLLVVVAVAMTALAVANIGEVTAAAACVEANQRTMVLCDAGPARLRVLVEALLACAAWCLVGMRAARLPR